MIEFIPEIENLKLNVFNYIESMENSNLYQDRNFDELKEKFDDAFLYLSTFNKRGLKIKGA